MDYTIIFSRSTVKELTQRLRLAWRSGTTWLIKRLSALLLLAGGRAVPDIAARLGVSTETTYAWRAAFLLQRWAAWLGAARPAPVQADGDPAHPVEGGSAGRPRSRWLCERAPEQQQSRAILPLDSSPQVLYSIRDRFKKTISVKLFSFFEEQSKDTDDV